MGASLEIGIKSGVPTQSGGLGVLVSIYFTFILGEEVFSVTFHVLSKVLLAIFKMRFAKSDILLSS